MSQMATPKQVTCIIAALGGGGAERAFVNLVRDLHDRNYQVTVLTLYRHIPDAYTLPPQVRRLYPSPPPDGWQRWFDLLGQVRRVKRIWRRLWLLRTDILQTQPDIVIAFIEITGIRVLRMLIASGVPVIVAEHTDPRYHGISQGWRIWRWLMYPFAASIVVLSEELWQWVQHYHPWWRVRVIPNPVPPLAPQSSCKPSFFGQPRTIIAVGRFDPVKQYHLLIDAFAQLAPQFPDWNLTILGDGDLRGEIEQQIESLKLTARITLPGRVPEPTAILPYADLFVMTSRYEGFPNALLEAMACGVTPVSFDCPSGPRAIIRHGVDGILVPPNDVQKLAVAMADLMANDERRHQLASRAKEVSDRFAREKIIGQWEQVIAAALSH